MAPKVQKIVLMPEAAQIAAPKAKAMAGAAGSVAPKAKTQAKSKAMGKASAKAKGTASAKAKAKSKASSKAKAQAKANPADTQALDLKAKKALIATGQAEPQDILSAQEFNKCSIQVQQTHLTKSDAAVEAWAAAGEGGPRAGTRAKKRQIVYAWLQDPEMRNTFINRIQSLSFTKKAKTQLEWLTMQQVRDRHGPEEGLQMIKDGSFLARKNPLNNKFWQFCVRSDSVEVTVAHMQAMKATASDKLTSEQFSAIAGGMKSMALQDTDDLNMNLDVPFEDASFDAEDAQHLPAGLVERLFGSKKEAKPKAKTSAVDQVETALQTGKVSGGQAKGKCRTMHGTIAKLLLALRGEWHNFSKTLTGKTAKTKQKAYQDIAAALSKFSCTLEKFLVEAHLGEKEVKELLVKCVGEYKTACALLEEMKADKE